MKRKTIFLALTLIVLSAANMSAQVRIGGEAEPNASAVLDLNATDAANNGALGLALPRVELTSTTAFTPLKAHVAGMTVYNTTTADDVAPGAYYNDGTKWIRIGSGSLISEVDGIIGNEVTNATSSGGLVRSGSGTADAPYTLGIADGGVTTTRIADSGVTSAKIANSTITANDLATGAVTNTKLDGMGATSGQVLTYNGANWAPSTLTAAQIGGCVKKVITGTAALSTTQYRNTITHESVTPSKSFIVCNAKRDDGYYPRETWLVSRTATSFVVDIENYSTSTTITLYYQIVEFY